MAGGMAEAAAGKEESNEPPAARRTGEHSAGVIGEAELSALITVARARTTTLGGAADDQSTLDDGRCRVGGVKVDDSDAAEALDGVDAAGDKRVGVTREGEWLLV